MNLEQGEDLEAEERDSMRVAARGHPLAMLGEEGASASTIRLVRSSVALLARASVVTEVIMEVIMILSNATVSVAHDLRMGPLSPARLLP